MAPFAELLLGDCRDVLPQIPAGYVDCVVTDPPYPEISRAYGRMSEADWHAMMRAVVTECRRVLKPKGSAVFVLQPNSEKLGRMRLWLWEFMVWAGREWGIVQDAYWWNTTALPKSNRDRKKTLPRPSVKPCVWLGDPDCYRDIDGVLKEVSDRVLRARPETVKSMTSPSGWRGAVKPKFMNRPAMYARAIEHGGSTPFNLLPIPNSDSSGSAGANGHPAGTPAALCNWWVRYLCPPGGTVLDPFSGSGTVALEAMKLGRNAVGIERHEPYHGIALRCRDDATRRAELTRGPVRPKPPEAPA